MYQPEEFQEHSRDWALEQIRRYPFGVMFGRTDSGYDAGHFPFQLARLVDGALVSAEHFAVRGHDDDQVADQARAADVADAAGGIGELVLEGHGAIRNELLTGMPDGSEVLLVFRGPSAYVSPGVYRAEPDVPTWNYTAVHVRGRYFRLPADANPGLLERTVRHNEAGQLGSGWSTSSMSYEELGSLARGVASFWVRIEGIEAGRKLSQDKLREDAIAVEAHFAGCPGEAHGVAGEMRETGLPGRGKPPTTDPATWLDAASAE